jgi:hypothetical protein
MLESVKQALLSLGDELREAEGVGICGSLARGYDFGETSDIDVFVVVSEKKPDGETDRLWWRRINQALVDFDRDVTVLVYSLKGLRKISHWYVLRLASEGVLVFDAGKVRALFDQIKRAARQAGLIEEWFEGQRIWKFPDLRLGENREVRLE